MKHEVEIDGNHLEIDLEQRDGRVQACVGSREYELEVVSPEAGVFCLISDDRIFECNVWEREQNSFRVLIDGRTFDSTIIDRKHRRTVTEHHIEGVQNLIAPMPGKVVRVMLAAGDEVESGQGVLVVEAMKMQNEIKSPKAGKVIEIRVVEGATVTAHQILAVVE
jgi:biotin carboxyl carrier protein